MISILNPQSCSRKVKILDFPSRDNKVRKTTHSDELSSEEPDPDMASLKG